MNLFTSARLRVLSGFFGNLAAGWFGAIIIVRNFSDLTKFSDLLILIADLVGTVFCLFIAFKLEEGVKHE